MLAKAKNQSLYIHQMLRPVFLVSHLTSQVSSSFRSTHVYRLFNIMVALRCCSQAGSLFLLFRWISYLQICFFQLFSTVFTYLDLFYLDIKKFLKIFILGKGVSSEYPNKDLRQLTTHTFPYRKIFENYIFIEMRKKLLKIV